jgi:6-phosphogluconate dehydrogenase
MLGAGANARCTVEAKREIGIVGLGRMGGGLALQALEKGVRVAGFTQGGARPELVEAGLAETSSLPALVAALAPPRAILVYVPAGAAVDEVLDGLAAAAEPGDVLVDGGNSYWGDSIRRAERLAARGLHLVDLGTSGGVDGARRGACFMAGGDAAAVARVEPILRDLAVAGGWVHAGGSGAGHFTKLVHNGIEFGMLQAIGEGVALLEAFRERLPIADVLRCWRNGSVIRSWLVDLLEEHYRASGGLAGVPPYVEDTGEVSWLVSDALRLEVPAPVIAQSVMQLLASRDGERVWARAIAAMRHGFGGHPFGPDAAVARERREGRLADPPADEGPATQP